MIQTFFSFCYYLHHLIPHPLGKEGSVPADVRYINTAVIRKHLRVLYPFDDDTFCADIIGVDHKEFVILLLDIAYMVSVKTKEIDSFFEGVAEDGYYFFC